MFVEMSTITQHVVPIVSFLVPMSTWASVMSNPMHNSLGAQASGDQDILHQSKALLIIVSILSSHSLPYRWRDLLAWTLGGKQSDGGCLVHKTSWGRYIQFIFYCQWDCRLKWGMTTLDWTNSTTRLWSKLAGPNQMFWWKMSQERSIWSSLVSQTISLRISFRSEDS